MNTCREGIAIVALTLLTVVTAGATDTAMPATGQDYIIGPGDVLEISGEKGTLVRC